MREIKFRAWVDEENKWVYFNVGEEYPTKKLSPFTVCEFTGLLDKTGKEIYEGDIVRRTMHYGDDYGNRVGEPEEKISEIKWIEMKGTQAVGFSFFPCDDIYQLEVIGNIYEHGKLIENK